MTKQYAAVKLDNILMRIVIPYSSETEEEGTEHYAGLLKSQAFPIMADGTKLKPVYDEIALGTPKEEPWTLKETYDFIDNLCAPLAAKLKKLYEDGIDVDPST